MIKNPVNQSLQKQIETLIKIVLINPYIHKILNGDPFPNKKHWYLGAGCLCQSVWNYLSYIEITNGIKDYDLVYYDPKDISKNSELKEQARIKNMFLSLPVKIEVINEARVHIWFEKDFGKKIDQYKSCEDAINTWPTTATAVGINRINSKVNVYAPYGLNDLFCMTVRANKLQITKDIYERKVEKWTKYWPNLVVIPWNQI